MQTQVDAVLLATSRYQSSQLIAHSGLAAVRITRGAPRFRLGYGLAGSILELAPGRELLRVTDETAFTSSYREQLDAVGVHALAGRFAGVQEASGATGLVLLCFEDVVGRQEFCHRRVFADWWAERTGERVPELGAMDSLPECAA